MEFFTFSAFQNWINPQLSFYFSSSSKATANTIKSEVEKVTHTSPALTWKKLRRERQLPGRTCDHTRHSTCCAWQMSGSIVWISPYHTTMRINLSSQIKMGGWQVFRPDLMWKRHRVWEKDGALDLLIDISSRAELMSAITACYLAHIWK